CCVPSEKLSTEVRWSVFQVKLNVARCRPGRLFVTAGTQHTMARLVVVSAARSAVVYEGGAQSGLPNGIATEAKAVARIQDAVYEWLVKAAAEVLMALSGPDDVDCVVSEDDRRDYSRRRETHVSFSKVRGEHSEWADQTEAGEVEKVIRKK
uniref:RNase_PH_C domain-containing protein n=1 Tax=Mesocestoides corti TaxID=53468 RepID=A0A5K3FRX9_MESCO